MLAFDVLESRLVPATRTVMTLADPVDPTRADLMTLRRAITELNGFPNENNSISFAAPLQGDVSLAFALPVVITHISIDGGPDISQGVHRIGVSRPDNSPLQFRI